MVIRIRCCAIRPWMIYSNGSIPVGPTYFTFSLFIHSRASILTTLRSPSPSIVFAPSTRTQWGLVSTPPLLPSRTTPGPKNTSRIHLHALLSSRSSISRLSPLYSTSSVNWYTPYLPSPLLDADILLSSCPETRRYPRKSSISYLSLVLRQATGMTLLLFSNPAAKRCAWLPSRAGPHS